MSGRIEMERVAAERVVIIKRTEVTKPSGSTTGEADAKSTIVPDPEAFVVGSTPIVVPRRHAFGVLLFGPIGTNAAAVIQPLLQRCRPFRSEIRVHRDQVADHVVEVGAARRIDRSVRSDCGRDVDSRPLRTAEKRIRRRHGIHRGRPR